MNIQVVGEKLDVSRLDSGSHIIQVCKGKRNSCGKDPITEEPLRWEYVKERKENAES